MLPVPPAGQAAAPNPAADVGAVDPCGPEGLVVDAVLSASRALVAVSARSLAALPEDVTLPQYRALVVIAARGPQRLADLAVALGVEPSTATRMCDRLVRKDLVYRRRTSTDRRGVRISLAVAGRELVEEVTRRRRAEIVAILGRVPTGTREMVLAGLSALAEAAGEPGEREWALGWGVDAHDHQAPPRHG